MTVSSQTPDGRSRVLQPTERDRLYRLLIVEDERGQRRTLSAILAEEGFEVTACGTAGEALRQLEQQAFGLAVIDLRLPDLTGTQLIEKMRLLNPDILVIVHTAYGSLDSAKLAMNLRAFAYVEKGGDPEELIRQVHAASHWHLERYAADLEAAVEARTRALHEANLTLQQEVGERRRAERELALHRDHLEEIIAQRTRALEESQERLRRADRLASLGTLAAGIAHEINNPLGTIMLAADSARASVENSEFVVEMLDSIKRDVERCGSIVRSVLQFATDQPADRWPVALNGIVRHSLDFTREHAREQDVELIDELGEGRAMVTANPNQLEQVFINLISNAVHACDEAGRVTLVSQDAGDRVRILVRDNGRGMEDAAIKQAFDPFYTTRLGRGGTGLGLSTCHGIVTNHGGEIEIVSELGRGSTVSVELPKTSTE